MAEHEQPRDGEQLPAPGSLQDHAVKADNVHPRPANRRRIGIALGIIGLIVVLNTIGNVIGVAVANSHSNSIVSNSAKKSHQRDLERDALERQLTAANKRIDALVTQTRTQQTGDDHAICVLLIGFIVQARNAGMPANPTGLALFRPVLTQLHCVVPKGLLP